MASRAQLANILKIVDRDEQLREADYLVANLIQIGKANAIAYNLLGDLLMKRSLCLKDARQAKTTMKEAVECYESSVKLDPKCVETAAAHGAALMALKQFGSAKAVLKRGNSIDNANATHPFLNHIGVTRDDGTKEQLIADAKARIQADLSYISVCLGDNHFTKVLNLLRNSSAQVMTILDAASALANKLPHCARARMVYPHAVLYLLGSGRLQSSQLSDKKKESVVHYALSNILELASDFPNSLVISLCCSNLNAAVCLYDAAQKEYCRAFNITNPDDPRNHDIPLGRTSGLRYTDRVVRAKVDILCAFIAFSNQVEDHFSSLSEELKASFLSFRVDKILEDNESGQEMAAVEYYRDNLSWVVWLCPSCQSYVTSVPADLLWHMYVEHVDSGSSEIFYHTVMDKLGQCKYVPNDDPHCGLYMSKDEDGHDVLCVKSLKCLSQGILDMLSRSLMTGTSPELALVHFVRNLSAPDAEEKIRDILDKLKRIIDILTGTAMTTKSPNSVLANFFDRLSILDTEDTNNFGVLKELWIKLLEMSAMDKREPLMALIATKRWEELKDMIEYQIAEPKICGPNKTTSENETLLIEETKGPEQNFEASRSNHHAYMYGHRALRPRISAIKALLSPTNEDKVVQEKEYNPYDNKRLHIQYMEDLSGTLSHLILCSACYFEMGNRKKRCRQIVFHFSKVHGGSVKCQICSARFRTADALAYHMNYCHNADPNNQQVIDGPD